jgi:hypothetical protein
MVKKKESNLSIHTELELYPICFKSYKLLLKHYARLIDIEVTNDKKLYSQNCSLHKLKNLLKLQSFQMPFVVFENAVEIFYKTTIPGTYQI